ncbi:unnamed protein product [Paramecium pentaurelia]|uniref:Regulator of chromosome condensation 1/beta-lactamase-inhibitor protein II n=1 Tax=Paramecium pentaurelia TaxID=43138 RepID=A0A8S1XX70_9CILI|nr:unnamed protein product [Paramecium pentaurelia]
MVVVQIKVVFFIGRTDLVNSKPVGSVNHIPLDAKIIKLCGSFRSFFLFGDKDDIWVFGDNSHGQLGLGEISDVQKKPQKLECNYSLISCSETYTYGYYQDRMYYWGENNFSCSQFKGKCLRGKQVSVKSVIQLNAQNERFYYISNGDLYGQGFTSLLGVKMNVVSTVKPVLIMNKVRKIACSNTHSLVLDENNWVYSWGNGKNGELGLQMAGYSFQTFVQCPTRIMQLEDIQDVQCGMSYSLVLNQEGVIYEWGSGLQNMSFEDALKIKEVQMPNTYSNIRKIEVALKQAACVDQLGRLYQWNVKNPNPQYVKTGFRCEQFICGDDIVLFIGNEQAYRVSEHFKQQIKDRVQKYKEYVEMKNNKIRNMYYDENKKTKCLQEINSKILDQQVKQMRPEDFLYTRLQRKSSMYVQQLKRRSTMMVPEEFREGQNSIHKKRSSTTRLEMVKEKINIVKQFKVQDKMRESAKEVKSLKESWEVFRKLSQDSETRIQQRTKIPLNILNTKLYQAIEIDKVSDLILESERLNPLYIPYQGQIIKSQPICQREQNIQSQPGSQRESRQIIKSQTVTESRQIVKSQPTTQREYIDDQSHNEFIDSPDIMKYEYVKRIHNGYHEKLLMDNLMTKEQCFLPIKWKRLKDDTKIFQGKYQKMQERLLKQQREAKKMIKISDA